jgi:hypothetical protein
MANWVVGRPGQINQTGGSFANDNALFLKLFSGEVLTTYQLETVMDNLVTKRTISGGKTAQFPVTGQVSAAYHVPGTEIVGANTNQNELTINVDDLLVAPVSIARIDEAKTQYDYRSIYSRECGRALARAKDKKLLRIAILAARAAAPISEMTAGSKLTDALMATDKTVLRTNLKLAAQKFDEKNVPAEDRVAVLPPASHYLLLEDDHVSNRFYDTGGSTKEGSVRRIYGIDLYKSNNIPTDNYAGVSGENNTYAGNFTTTVGVVFQREAVGTVNLIDLATEMEYSVSRQAWLVVAKYACGHGILRASNAIELATA